MYRSSERRRVILASVVTAVAIPTLWIVNGNDSDAKTAEGGTTIPTAPPTDPYQPATPVFVGNDGQTVDQGGVVSVAVAAGPTANSIKGKASYYRYPATLDRPCTAPAAPDGATLTIINVDNGQSTTCTNIVTDVMTSRALQLRVDIIMHTTVFSEIGDVTDSPIDVRVTW
ncbi:MAG TPA: hypothetical protein PLV13_09790 [Ilumatobacteraceae bacterium]|nr:hypothetical protein [Ilumatobacteraceae bacterium]